MMMLTYRITTFFMLFCLLIFSINCYLTDYYENDSSEEGIVSDDLALPSIKKGSNVITQILESFFLFIKGSE